MNPTTTTVKVCLAEFDDSRPKGSITDACREAAPESTIEL